MKIVIASDHAGFELKKFLIESLKNQDSALEVIDMGPEAYDEHDDYPDYIKKVGEYVSKNSNPDECRGIVIGGSGQGENICANRYAGVRSVLVYGNDMELNDTIAKLSREHNNANVIAFAARFIENENALKVLNTWLHTAFSNDERHIRRLIKLEN